MPNSSGCSSDYDYQLDSQLGSGVSLDPPDTLQSDSTSVGGPLRTENDGCPEELKSTAESRPAYASHILRKTNDQDRPVVIMTR